MGTFREMAVSGQTSSHQDGKLSVQKCMCVFLPLSLDPTGDLLRVESSSVTLDPLITFK